MSCGRLVCSLSRKVLLSPSNHQVTCCALAHTIKVKRYYEPTEFVRGRAVITWENELYNVEKIETGPKLLKVILTKNIKNVGIEGEVVELPKRVSRFLLHNNKAVYASPDNIKELAAKVALATSQTVSGRKMEQHLMGKKVFKLRIRDHIEWKLTPEILSRCFQRDAEIYIPPQSITLPEEEITNKDVGSSQKYQVQISVNKLKPITCKVQFVRWSDPKPDQSPVQKTKSSKKSKGARS